MILAGLVSLETAYPLTLGSNIGTTTTSILASFAAEGKYLKPSIQVFHDWAKKGNIVIEMTLLF
jgi:Na+/phosphate symporter